MRFRPLLVALAIVGADASGVLFSQERPLVVQSAAPFGELTNGADANEIRIVFSEPMVALGGPVTEPPAWLSIAPAIRANYYWSGSRTLIVSADPDQPLPLATRFAVRVAASARSTTGRSIASAYSFNFTTPTIRLLGTEWYRPNGQATANAVMALRFNQPVRPSDVLSHLTVSYNPHTWVRPQMSDRARERLRRDDPGGLARFDAKVARTAEIAASSARIPVNLASTWDETRFPRAPNVVVIETAEPPATDAWLSIATDSTLPSPAGPVTGPAQQTIVRLEPTFFVGDFACTTRCAPGYSSIGFRRGVHVKDLAARISIADSIAGRSETALKPTDPAATIPDLAGGSSNIPMAWLGFANQPPASTRVIKVDGSLTATDGQVLGYPWLEVIDMLHAVPYTEWGGSVWESQNGATVPVMARNVTRMSTWMQPMTLDGLMSQVLMFRTNSSTLPPSMGAPVPRALKVTDDVAEAHGVDLRPALAAGGTGLVWASVAPTEALPGSAMPQQFGVRRGALLQVTNLGITVKDSPYSTLLAVTRLDNAAAVAGARVAIVNAEGKPLWSGTTGADGVAMAPALPLRSARETYRFSYLVTAEKDGDLAWIGSDWTGDLSPWSFGLSYVLDEQTETLRGSIFTDRGVYTRGEAVSIKGIFRGDSASGTRLLPAGTRLTILTYDAQAREYDRRSMTLSQWSSADWKVTIPEGAALGASTVTAYLGDAPDRSGNSPRLPVSGSFLVAAFRKPDFRVDAKVAAAPPVMGSPIAATAEAAYLFGTPIGAQPVRWFALRTVTQSVPEAIQQKFDQQQYAFGYLPQDQPRNRQDRVIDKNESLDTTGRVRAEIPTQSGDDYASTYRFEAEVPSASGQRIANRADIVMHPASIYVGLTRPKFFTNLNDALGVSAVAVDLTGAVRPGVSVTVSLLREQWTSERRPENPGSVNWVRKEIPAGEWTVTTAAAPVRVPATLKDGGCFILRAVARDPEGRPTRTETRFYALGGGYSMWRTNGNRIELTPERTLWKPGETARVLVQSPWSQATALVTKEREGIKTHQRIDINSTQDAVEIPITEADVPNVYVSVVLFKGRTDGASTAENPDPGKPAFRVGYVELTVDDASKRLHVDVKADRQEYRPRENVNVSVAVRDAGGRPRLGEVTLWAVDYGLLSLTNYQAPDVARAIYARKSLQVQTLDTRLRLIGKQSIVAEPPAAAAGGRGGGGGGGFAAQAGGVLAESVAVAAPSPLADTFTARASTVSGLPQSQINVSLDGLSPDDPAQLRTDFRSLVFWLGSVATDADGRAATTVTLPDSLTTFRIIAVAGDTSSHFGAADTEIRSSKPLTLLASFPRFLSVGDQASFGAIVTNNTDRAGDAVVRVGSLDASRVAFQDAASQTVRLAPGESRNVRFRATARRSGAARIRMAVTLGANTDAFELPLAVSAPLQLETVAAYGDTATSAMESVRVPPNAMRDRGGLTVSLASTALVGLGESARYLQDYPYECAEQKASKALALLLSADLGGTFSMGIAKPEQVRADGIRLLRDLSGYQCGDGGFGMFPGSCYGPSSVYLTAYVLDVMHRAGGLGAAVDSTTIERALNFLAYNSRPAPVEAQWWPAWAASHAYAQKVLSEGGRDRRAEVDRLYAVVDRMPVFALSYLADAMVARGERTNRYADVTRRITNALRIDADRAHVEEVDDAALVWLWNTNVRATAVVLDGIARRKDDGTFVSPMVRWLLAARQNGRWSTTQENVVALSALVNYYKAFESETPDMTASVSLAGQTVGTAKFAGRSTTAQQVQLTMAELVKQAAATTADLRLSRTGTGRLFYTARLQYGSAVPSTAVVNRGIRIERRYQKMNPDGLDAPAMSFADGDLVRVTLTVSLPHEGRFLAFTDPLPAGFEAVDGTLKTTASDLARVATTQSSGTDGWAWWRRGGFDHVEKHDDRVMAFATRLAAGRHEFTYLARATTAGTFTAAGASAEAMYAPEITGRSASATVTIK
jgi:uncharacterized protein YfaS (alpha-2-macroglobulin family)